MIASVKIEMEMKLIQLRERRQSAEQRASGEDDTLDW